MKQSFFEAARNYPYREKFMQLVHDTPIEVAIGAVTLGALFGGTSYLLCDDSANMVPTAFSEIGAINREFRREGAEPPPLTRFYAKTNDVVMKVIEARNLAEKHGGGSDKSFARELEFKMSKELKVHHLITEYANEVPKDADEAARGLPKLDKAIGMLPQMISAFDGAWSSYYRDTEHQECETKNVCTGSGKDERCSPQTTCRMVCDYRTTYFTYHKEQGIASARMLENYVVTLPDLSTSEKLHLAKETGADNEYAIETSMKSLLKGKIVTPEEALSFANIWATGSNFAKLTPGIYQDHAALKSLAGSWKTAAHTATSSSDVSWMCMTASSPREMALAETMAGHARGVLEPAREIMDGIRFGGQAVPRLSAKVQEYIAVTLDGKKGDSDDLRDEVMDLATDTYKKNYAGGLDVTPFHVSPVVLWSIFGIVAGAAAGFAVDSQLRKRRDSAKGNPYNFR